MPGDLGLAAELEQVRGQRDALVRAAEAVTTTCRACASPQFLSVADGCLYFGHNELRAALAAAKEGTA